MFGVLKQELAVGTWVRLGNTGGSELDGMIGRVLGRSTIDICDHYIVLLGKKLSYSDDAALCITEACIEPHETLNRLNYLDKGELLATL